MSNADAAIKDEAARWWGVMHGPDSEAERQGFEAWRASDVRHRDAYAHLERAWDAASALGATGMGRNRSLPPPPAKRSWTSAPGMALAASLAIVLLASIVWLSRSPSAPPLTVMASVEKSRVGEIRSVKLSDGSSVILDTDSRIEILFDAGQRKVRLLAGRARFEVRGDTRQFVVEAGDRLLSAASGRFDVQLVPEGVCLQSLDAVLNIRPLTGMVAGAPGLRLASGQTVTLAPRGGDAAPVASGKGSELWAEGMLVFQGVPLSRVLDETNRYSATRITLGDPALGARRVTGTFRPLPVEELANALAAAFGLKVRRISDGSLILEEP